MQTSTKSAVAAAALAVATIAIVANFADATADASPRRHVVEIRKFKFVPAQLDVSPGDTIVWINRDIAPHTITAADKSWDSGTIKKSGEWQTVVQSGMPAAYFCRFHPKMKAQFVILQ